jgi:hypothetical protein
MADRVVRHRRRVARDAPEERLTPDPERPGDVAMGGIDELHIGQAVRRAATVADEGPHEEGPVRGPAGHLR